MNFNFAKKERKMENILQSVEYFSLMNFKIH